MKKGRWSDSFTHLTKEYLGGVIAGVGAGILIAMLLVRRCGVTFTQETFAGELQWLVLPILFIAIGSSLARQGRNSKKGK